MQASGKLTLDLISSAEALTLPGLFLRRCEKTPEAEAYRQYDPAAGTWRSYRWREMKALAGRWRAALARENLTPGERVAILLRNSVEWVCFDQAAQSLGLAVVPLYVTDNPENIAHILRDSDARLLLVRTSDQWQALAPLRARFPGLARVLCLERADAAVAGAGIEFSFVADWLESEAAAMNPSEIDAHALATIVYTSGTTGRPKGVMLSHYNILSNAEAVLKIVPAYREDLFLSFLPLSHAFERTVGYYLPIMTGSTVAFARSAQDLAQDLLAIRPTMLISVPRIYDRAYARVQQGLEKKGFAARALFAWTEAIGWRRFEAAQGRGAAPGALANLPWPLLRRLVADQILARFGGRLRLAISGGAPLSPKLARCFIGLGVPLLQGYGLTEAAPIVSGNLTEDNVPDSVGVPLPGIEIKLAGQNELLLRGPNVMLGYWNRPQDTREAIDADGWLHTGDQARIMGHHLYITGRLKEILVTSTGEKIAPADLEMAITSDPLFAQAMVVGEGMPHLAALIVLDPDAWPGAAKTLRLDAGDPASLKAAALLQAVRGKVRGLLRGFPSHARVRETWLTLEPWTIENGLITPTLKLKRTEIEQRFAREIRELYAEHRIPK
jgi:long-chain acyl-CoA synthetase